MKGLTRLLSSFLMLLDFSAVGGIPPLLMPGNSRLFRILFSTAVLISPLVSALSLFCLRLQSLSFATRNEFCSSDTD